MSASEKSEFEETELVLEASDDQKTVTLTIKSEHIISTADLVECLEFYLCELTRAVSDRKRAGDDVH